MKLHLSNIKGGIVVFENWDLVKISPFKQDKELNFFLGKENEKPIGFWNIELQGGKIYSVKGKIQEYDRLVKIIIEKNQFNK